jgi:hypothetical protein
VGGEPVLVIFNLRPRRFTQKGRSRDWLISNALLLLSGGIALVGLSPLFCWLGCDGVRIFEILRSFVCFRHKAFCCQVALLFGRIEEFKQLADIQIDLIAGLGRHRRLGVIGASARAPSKAKAGTNCSGEYQKKLLRWSNAIKPHRGEGYHRKKQQVIE